MPTGELLGSFRWSSEAAAKGCFVALLAVGSATLMTLLLQSWFLYPFLFLFFGAVMVSAWFGGMVGGLISVLLSTCVVDYYFVPPIHSFSINATAEAYFVSFIVCTVIASLVSSSKRNSEAALKVARDELETRVSERTAELRRSNLELQESERRLRRLTEVIPQQIWSGTRDGSIDYCNQQLLAYTGKEMNDMQGERFFQTIHPADREGFHQAWLQALSTERSLEGEWRVCGGDGRYRWFFTRCVPLRDASGSIVRWYGTNTDIEERHKAEEALLKTQSELANLSRSLSMGELTVSIAHEVSQPLAAAVTHGEACLEWLSANPPNVQRAQQSVRKLIQDGTRAGAVLARVRALYQKEVPAKTWFDMREVVDELNLLFRDETTRRGIEIHIEIAPDLPKIEADRVFLQQVILNLMLNAMEAMAATPEGQRQLVIRATRESAAEIRISVEDTGTGLDEKTSGEIFKPFFTTKPHGIGVGLSISQSIVQAHGGRLWATPRPAGGAAFQFTIPIRSESPDE